MQTRTLAVVLSEEKCVQAELYWLMYDMGGEDSRDTCSCISYGDNRPWTEVKTFEVGAEFLEKVYEGDFMKNVESIHVAIAEYQDTMIEHLCGYGRWTTNKKKQLYGKERFKEI